jgi:hypothetical protein
MASGRIRACTVVNSHHNSHQKGNPGEVSGGGSTEWDFRGPGRWGEKTATLSRRHGCCTAAVQPQGLSGLSPRPIHSQGYKREAISRGWSDAPRCPAMRFRVLGGSHRRYRFLG